MKIVQLLSGMNLVLNNQEREFVERHGNSISLTSLTEQEQWLAQNLVRKGFYSISNDSKFLVKS